MEQEAIKVNLRLKGKPCEQLRIVRNHIVVSKDFEKRQYRFDNIFDHQHDNKQLYQQMCSSLVNSFMDGYNVSILSYGQTGSGKTFSMYGRNGIIIESLQEIMEKRGNEQKIEIGAIQIYMDNVFDLLENNQKLSNIFNNKYTEMKDMEHIVEMQRTIQNNKYIAQTQLNQSSSRSHVIQIVRLTDARGQRQLYLVDLAGSERIKKSKPKGIQISESKFINQSLTCLGKCIQNLGQQQHYINYRDSKLTRILSNSLGGNSRTTLLCCVTDELSNLEETISTLQFGQRAMKVVNIVNKENLLTKDNKENQLQCQQYQSNQYLKEIQQLKMENQMLQEYKQQSEILKENINVHNVNELKIKKMEEENREFLVEVDEIMNKQECQIEEQQNKIQQYIQERVNLKEGSEYLLKKFSYKINKQVGVAIGKLSRRIDQMKQNVDVFRQKKKQKDNQIIRQQIEDILEQQYLNYEHQMDQLDDKTQQIEQLAQMINMVRNMYDQKIRQCNQQIMDQQQLIEQQNEQIMEYQQQQQEQAIHQQQIIQEYQRQLHCQNQELQGSRSKYENKQSENNEIAIENIRLNKQYKEQLYLIEQLREDLDRKKDYQEIVQKNEIMESKMKEMSKQIDYGDRRIAELKQQLNSYQNTMNQVKMKNDMNMQLLQTQHSIDGSYIMSQKVEPEKTMRSDYDRMIRNDNDRPIRSKYYNQVQEVKQIQDTIQKQYVAYEISLYKYKQQVIYQLDLLQQQNTQLQFKLNVQQSISKQLNNRLECYEKQKNNSDEKDIKEIMEEILQKVELKVEMDDKKYWQEMFYFQLNVDKLNLIQRYWKSKTCNS